MAPSVRQAPLGQPIADRARRRQLEARMQLPVLRAAASWRPAAIVSTQRQYIVHQPAPPHGDRPCWCGARLRSFRPSTLFALVPPQQRVPRLAADPGLRTQLRHHRPFSFFAASTNCGIRSSTMQVSFHGIGRPSCRALKTCQPWYPVQTVRYLSGPYPHLASPPRGRGI